jgi:hypothetical protein
MISRGSRLSLSSRLSLIFLALLAGLLLAWGVVLAAPNKLASPGKPPVTVLSTPMPLPDRPVVASPNISFIDSPTASCELPRSGTGDCYITWPYLYINGDPNYIITMTIGIDDKPRARFDGFFQTSMYVPAEMMDFRVACGAPGSGGDPNVGLTHSFVIRARDSSGLGAANYGTVTCPADEPRLTYLPMIPKSP